MKARPTFHSPVTRARRSILHLAAAFGIAVVLLVFNMLVTFSGALRELFGAVSENWILRLLANLLFIWLAGMLLLAFKRWREAERRREELEAIVDSISPDALLVIGSDNRIQMSNRSVRRVLGVSESEIIGKSPEELFGTPKMHPGSSQELYLALREEGFSIGLATARKPDGQKMHVEMISAKLMKHGGSLLLVRDVTARIQEETQQKVLADRIATRQKLESLGVMAGGFAHDFNNLLAGVLGNAELAYSKLPPDSTIRPGLEEIIKAAKRAAGICRDMLAYAGKGKLKAELLDLSQAINRTKHILQVTTPANASLSYDLTSSIPYIMADPSQIHQVILSLAANAGEAMCNQEGAIRFSTRVEDCDENVLKALDANDDLPAGKYVILEIADSGCGMTEETLSHAFEPFFTTKVGHKGLGLASARGIVRGHRGGMKLASTYGEGSTVSLFLPASAETPAPAAEQDPVTKPPAEPDVDPTTLRGSGTVLVVEDEEMIQRFVTQAISSMGYTVLSASDGIDGVDVFRQHADEITLVLLDLSMPRMGGEEAFGAMRSIKPDCRVILSSGDIPSNYHGPHPDGFIHKPYEIDDLMREVYRVATL